MSRYKLYIIPQMCDGSWRPPLTVIRELMIYMLFALGLCRDKHVKPSTTDVSSTTITETAMYCSKISKHETETEMIMSAEVFQSPPFFLFFVFGFLANRRDEYQQTNPVLSTREAY